MPEVKDPDEGEAAIEAILGRPLEQDPVTLASLNDVPPELVDEARRLPGVLKFSFLLRYVESTQRFHLQQFVEDVVENREDPRRWKKGRVLYPTFSQPELLVREVSDILAILAPPDAYQWLRFPPERLAWERGMSYPGAPALVAPNLDYQWEPGSHVGSFVLSAADGLEPMNDTTIGTRRWVASRIAAGLPGASMRTSARDAREWLAQVFSDVPSISHDATIAVAGLLQEERLMVADRGVPGFRGPDDWYARPSGADLNGSAR